MDRGGMYSYDWLEKLIGLDIHSAETIRDEWQHLSVGDRVVLVPDGWMGMKGGYSLPVARIEAEPGPHAASVTAGASVGCRLVVRDHSDGPGQLPAGVSRSAQS